MDKNKKKKLIQATNFIEELSWLLDKKNNNVSLKESVEILRDTINIDFYPDLFDYSNNLNSNPNKTYLVGVLPSLFLDEELFKTIDDLLSFAKVVLKLDIKKSSKRSRMEYIGWIVCQTSNLQEHVLYEVVDALQNIIGNDNKLKKFKEEKNKPDFSWNETISLLSIL